MFVSLLIFAVTLLSGATAETLDTPNKYEYMPVKSFNPSAGEVTFKVKASNDAHVALSEDGTHGGKKYEIVIGGWGNHQSVIRPGNQGKNLVAKGGTVLDRSKHIEFRISWDATTIKVEREGKVFMELTGRDKPPHDKYNWDIKHVMVSTGWGSPGNWEFEASKTCREGRSHLQINVAASDNGEETTVALKRWSSTSDGWAKRKSLFVNGVPSNTVTPISHCIDKDKCYKLAVKDKGKNGMGDGGYTIVVDGVQFADSPFDSGNKEAHTFGCGGGEIGAQWFLECLFKGCW